MGHLLSGRGHAMVIPPGRRAGATRGFTLIEVLVALSILTVALTSIYRLQSDTFRMSDDTRFYTLAPMLAQQKLSEIERQGLSLVSGGSGDFGQAFPGYAWSLRIEDAQSELIKNPKHHLIRLDLEVTRDEVRRYTLRTYRFYVD
jgi:general secretion pathway protein I